MNIFSKNEKHKNLFPIDNEKEWIKVDGDLERLEVPGGWLYRDFSGQSITMTFVPFLKEEDKNGK